MKSTGWDIIYRDDSDYGHDKGQHLRLAKQKRGQSSFPLIVFIGDGVSDLSAAMEADVVFAKKGKDLESWCLRKEIKHIAWSDFSDILRVLKHYF
jgi:2-hydroxy-3-keto-5-methylthiopentenyl-1-phosphate phosphatase